MASSDEGVCGDKNQKIDFKGMDEDEIIDFLEEIQSHPALYDKSNGGYKNLRNKAYIYTKIGQKFDMISNVIILILSFLDSS